MTQCFSFAESVDMDQYDHGCFMQKALKEKEIELLSLKNQKLENLCRALQDERKALSQKLSGSEQAGADDVVNASSVTTEKATEATEEVPVTKEEEAVSTNAVSQDPETPIDPICKSPADATPLTKELFNLKAEKARLQEIEAAFTIRRHMPPEACEDSDICAESLDDAQGEQQVGEELSFTEEMQPLTDTLSEEHQELRDKDMQSVD